MSDQSNYILAFLEHRGLDYQHRTLKLVWAFSDEEIESTHDFMQWVFPTMEASKNVFDGPKMTPDELELVRQSNAATSSILQSSEWFMGFLERSDTWKRCYDHNHLRVTRMLESLVLVGKGQKAKELFTMLTNDDLCTRKGWLEDTTLNYWKQALTQ